MTDAGNYVATMSDRENRLVWYASYGSNCSRARFLTYLTGGPIPGRDNVQVGARDDALPRADAPHEFDHQVRFVGRSYFWGGAPAFLEHRETEPGALGRRYLITWGQLDDVVAQESQRTRTALPLERLSDRTRLTVGEGRYDCLYGLAPIDGLPVVTFTSPDPPEARQGAAPSRPYLSTIVNGLVDTNEWSIDQICARLRLVDGVAETWSEADIVSLATP